MYVVNKIALISSRFIKGLVYFHGVSILTSGILIGLIAQFDNTLVNFDNLAYSNLLWPLRVVVFIATPVVIVVVILRALNLTTKKRRLESEWTRNQPSTTKLFLKHNKLDWEKRKVMKALSNMKVVEVSTEGVPQLYILIVLILFATLGQEGNCVGLLDKNDP